MGDCFPASGIQPKTSAGIALVLLLLPCTTIGQALTGALIGTVRDEHGAVLPDARVTISSLALMGGPQTIRTNELGQLRFPVLPPGIYSFEIQHDGFVPYRETDLHVGAGATIERTAVLRIGGLATSIVVEGAGTRIDVRDPGFGSRFSPGDVTGMPTRRASMFDFIRATPGIAPTSPASGTATTVSAFGSGTNENQFLIDGTNTTCPCNGAARSEPGVDFIEEVQVQSVGASAEFGNLQGAVINVISKRGGERFRFEAAHHSQFAVLTSQPVTLLQPQPTRLPSGYHRAKYRDISSGLGGPVVNERLWFFAGYQHLRDHDSQPGTDPRRPRTYEMEKMFGKLTWRFGDRWQLTQSFHNENGFNPDRPTIVTPFEATTRPHISVPTITFGHLTHIQSPTTLWEVRAGRFLHTRNEGPSAGNLLTPSRFDRLTGVTSGAPPRVGSVTIARATSKATLTHFRSSLLGAAHQWKIGGQFERGEHHAITIIPTGTRYEDRGGVPIQAISSSPSNIGGVSLTASAFATDSITVRDRLTLSVGVRFDRSQAVSQDLSGLDPHGNETAIIVRGAGTLYTWNQWSPRLGLTTKLSADGRTMLRASYGRFFQGVLTGELESAHPGATETVMVDFNPSTGDYSGNTRRVDPKVNVLLDRNTRAPRTDEYSLGVDRTLNPGIVLSAAYVHKNGRDFIGWTDIAGRYVVGGQSLADGRNVSVLRLDTSVTPVAARRFLLTNPAGYGLTYNGMVIAAEKRAQGWQLFGSYTLSKATGLLPSSGALAAGAQASTVSPPQPLTFGRDPNDLTNAWGLLPNDRTHMFRARGSAAVPRTGLVVAASLQHFTGKPWTAVAQTTMPQGEQRIMLEPRGSRRLSSQMLLDVRVSTSLPVRGFGRVELLLDVLNLLNDDAEESLETETLLTATQISTTFGQPASFVDPRRAMLSVRVGLGR